VIDLGTRQVRQITQAAARASTRHGRPTGGSLVFSCKPGQELADHDLGPGGRYSAVAVHRWPAATCSRTGDLDPPERERG
jgi:hypothetical protein